MAMTRDQLHSILDSVPDKRLSDVPATLERPADPVLLALLSAPEDDEETTGEDLAALEATRDAYRRGETISHDEVRREFGL